MNIKTLLCTTLIAGCAFADAPSASSEHNYYVGVQYNAPVRIYTDLLDTKKSTKQSFPNMDFSVGTKIGDYFRAEFAPGYRSFKYKYTNPINPTDEIKKMSVTKLMFNAYLDAPKVADLFTPYVMVGTGYAKISGTFKTTPSSPEDEKESSKLSGNNFVWQTGIGVNTTITDNLSMDLGIVYANYGNVKISKSNLNSDIVQGTNGANISKTKLRDIEALIGLRYHF